MGILITSVQVPFIRGGGEILAENLREQIARRGYRVDVLTNPFRFSPARSVEAAMKWWGEQDLQQFCASRVHKVIHLKFPCYGAHHPNATTWMLHQFRSYYELWDEAQAADPENRRVRELVQRFDTESLARMPERYTIARTVSDRLLEYNGLESVPIYHPPKDDALFYTGESLPYIFAPSRLEPLKRQMLLVEAMAKVKSRIHAVIAGEGGHEAALRQRIDELGVHDRVRLVGRLSDEQMRAYYANARAVFFGPYREDYGYVTLEAMLAEKPVITCEDAGGVLEFVIDDATGAVTEPQADQVAEAIERYAADPDLAVAQGRAGRQRYRDMRISWDAVLNALLA
jgi:glycosyltransferase involved in cell wall biosynthesis